jgi:membrane-bound lytic murein transglycosylase D
VDHTPAPSQPAPTTVTAATVQPAPPPHAPAPAPRPVDPASQTPLFAALEKDADAPDQASALELQKGAEVEAAEDESLPEVTAALAEEPATSGAPTPSDPSDYEVHPDQRVTVQAAETLGHYAEWLEVGASSLRAKNNLRSKQPLVIGRKVKLDFSRVTPDEFERRRLEYHRSLQSEFFDHFTVTGTEQHVLRKGETLWYLAARKYRVPVWLLRQYNPDVDFGALQTGTAMVVPVIEPRAETPPASGDEGEAAEG